MVLRLFLSQKWFGIVLGLVCVSLVHAEEQGINPLLSNETAFISSNNQTVDPSNQPHYEGNGFEEFLKEASQNSDMRPVEAFDLEELQQELLKILASHYKSVFEKRNTMFAKLSQESQERIKKAEELYQRIVEKIDITSVVHSLADDVQKEVCQEEKFLASTLVEVNPGKPSSQGVITREVLSKEKLSVFSGLIAKLKRSLTDRSFILLFKGFDDYEAGQPGMMAAPEDMINMAVQFSQGALQPKPLTLSADELEQLVNYFDEIEAKLGEGNVSEAIRTLHAYLIAVHKKQSAQVTALVLASIKNEFDTTFEYLKETIALLEKNHDQQADAQAKEAYEFWLRSLRKSYRSLWVFDSLRSNASPDSTKLSHNLFTLVTYGYDIAQGFFDLYKLDNQIGLFSGPVAADWALSAALASWHFFNLKSDFSNGQLLHTILGDLKIDTFDARQLLMYNVFLLPSALPVLFDPAVWNKKPYGLVKSFHKVATAWIYYVIVDGNLFGEDPTEWWAAGSNIVDAQGKRKDRHLRHALLYSIKEGVHYLSSIMQKKIVYSVKPMTLERIRTYSMGIIRPAMISYVLEAAIPFLLLQDSQLGNPAIPGINRVVDFNRFDLFGSSFMKKSAQYHGFEKDEFFIEYILASYLGQSVGGFWGRKFVQGYRSQLYALGEQTAGVIGSILETIGLLSAQQVQSVKDFKNELISEFEYDIAVLKLILRGVFEVNSSFRNVIIPHLINHRYLDENETNPIEINRVLVYFTVDLLAKWRLLTYYDAARIAHKFDNDPQAIEKMIDNVISAVLKNLPGAAGEHVGSVLGRAAAEVLILKSGPLYSRFNKPAENPL